MKKLILIFSMFIVLIKVVPGQIITTVAGCSPVTNVQAASIGMEIYGAVADKHGNLYVSDGSSSVVRKVNLSTGLASIVAGTGNYGYGGDGGQASATSLSPVGELALDTAGNLYIGDLNGAGVRKVDLTTGIITTVAGNGTMGYSGDGQLATTAQLSGETSLCFDKNNNMYLADFGNQRVRKVNAQTGIITTIAGTGTAGYNGDNILATNAQLNYPAGLCVDDSNNVFIGEQSNSRIRKINAKTGLITTVGGNGGFGYSGDGGLATSATLWCPISIRLDKSGNIFLADWGNNRVRKIDRTSGIITTIAGNGTAIHSGDGGPATAAGFVNSYCLTFDTTGNLFVVEGYVQASSWNRWVRKIDAGTNNISTVVGNGGADYNGDGIPATTAQLGAPTSVRLDAQGNLYIADYANSRIRKINSSGMISTFAGDGSPGYKNGLPANSAECYFPYDLAFDKSGNAFIADQANDRIRKLNTHDTLSTIAGNGSGSPYNGGYGGDNGQATLAKLYYPSSLALDTAGNIYFADQYNHRVRKINSKTGIITLIAGNGTQGYSGDGGKATSARLNYPSGLALDDSNNVYIADTYNNCIRKVYATTGTIATVIGNGTSGYAGDGGPGDLAELNGPEGVAFDRNRAMYISDTYNGCIRKVDAGTKVITTIAGNGIIGFSGDGGPAIAAELNNPSNVAFDSTGNMYIADQSNNRIRKVSNIVQGIKEFSDVSSDISVLPNPNDGHFVFRFRSTEQETISHVEIYTVLGKTIFSEDPANAQYDLHADISAEPPGIYFYRIQVNGGGRLAVGKIVIDNH